MSSTGNGQASRLLGEADREIHQYSGREYADAHGQQWFSTKQLQQNKEKVDSHRH